LDLSAKVVKLLLEEFVLPGALVELLSRFLGVNIVSIAVCESLRKL
jgi:hypothetical protein